MATQKALRFLYQAKANTTGLTDITAEIYVNGSPKAVGVNAIKNTANANGSIITEIDSTNSPGVYEVYLAPADLTAWGVAAGSYSALEALVNSASKSAPAIFRQEETVANIDDIDSKLGTPAGASVSADIATLNTKLGAPAGASVSADIASVKSDTSAIKADLETGSASLATILSNIQALQNGSISNGVGYVLPEMIIPSSGSNTYKIPITIMDNVGALIDPTSNLVVVGCLNASGADRGSYLTGSSGSPAQVNATRDSLGQYHVMVSIPSSAVEEELLFSFGYTVGSAAMVRYGQAQLVLDSNISGYALQSTLLATQTTVNANNAILSSATYGNAAIKTELDAVQTSVNANNTLLANGVYGLSALQAQAAASQGAGFSSGSDSLHAISQFLAANIYQGGKAV